MLSDDILYSHDIKLKKIKTIRGMSDLSCCSAMFNFVTKQKPSTASEKAEKEIIAVGRIAATAFQSSFHRNYANKISNADAAYDKQTSEKKRDSLQLLLRQEEIIRGYLFNREAAFNIRYVVPVYYPNKTFRFSCGIVDIQTECCRKPRPIVSSFILSFWYSEYATNK